MENKNLSILSRMFLDYGINDEGRALSYYEAFRNVDSDLLNSAVNNVVMRSKFPPTKADIYEEMAKVVREVANYGVNKSFESVWSTIRNKAYGASSTKCESWDFPELEETIKRYGWRNIWDSMESDLPRIKRGVKEIYDEVCLEHDKKLVNGIMTGSISFQNLLQSRADKIKQKELLLAKAEERLKLIREGRVAIEG